MKKKALVAMLLACSFALGTASMTACNLIGGDNGDGEHQEQGDMTVAVTGVELNKDTLNLKTGDSETLIATVAPANATTKTVTWQSSDPSVASVDGSGKVTAHAEGTATITVTTTSGSKTDACTVNVTEEPPAPVNVISVSLDTTSKTLDVGGNVTLTPSFNPTNADNKNVTWSSSDPAVASVSGGVVTAHKAGTATITVTTEDGNKTATCAITVKTATPTTVKVTGVELDRTSASIKVNQTVQLTATVKPADASNRAVTWQSGNTAVATVDSNGLVTAKAAGTATITVKTDDGNYTKTCTVTVQAQASQPVVDAKISYSYAGNESAAFEWADTNADNAMVEYKLNSASSYTTLSGNDKKFLVRQISPTTARVDFVGLKGGAVYDFRITPSSGTAMTVTNMTINSYDRSGYAHFKKSDGVGAYNDDGTPKSNANVIYVNEQNKNDEFTVEGKTYKGVVGVLTNSSKFKNSLIVRIVGTVGAATWKQGVIDYGEGKATPKDSVVLKDGTTKLSDFITAHSNEDPLSQATLAKYGANELDTSVYSVLDGLSSKIINGSKEYDSCWNDCSISGAKNVTVEGIGEDARIFQWGMTFKNSNSIEVRNLTFEDYTEDACSFEGGSSNTSSTSADGFTYKNFWVHHNTFEEGVNYWDVCSEQDKHDGDGSTDIKRVAYVTFSYNIYHNTHKTGLVGSENDVFTAAVTFHHNLYDGCKARLPLARQANMHMYNNYYKGTTGTDISLRGSAYALVENCFFEVGKDKNGKAVQSINFDLPYDSKFNGENGNGWAKVIGCKFVDVNGNDKEPKTSFGDNVPTTCLKLNAGRTDKLNTTNKYGANFDTDSSVFYYENGQSKVSVLFTAAETKTYVPQLAGVQQRGVDVTLGGAGGGSGTGTGTETPNPNPNPGDETATDYKGVYTITIADSMLVYQTAEGSNAKAENIVTGNTATVEASDLKFGDNDKAVTLKFKVTKGQTVTIALDGRSGSNGNAATLVCTASGSVLSLNGSDSAVFSSATYTVGASPETATISYTADETGEVTVTIKRKDKSVKLYKIVLTISD